MGSIFSMTNNDIIRRLRYCFDLRDQQVIKLFKNVKQEISNDQLLDWLKPETDESQVPMKDVELASFLNGIIVEKRGLKDGKFPEAERQLNNNIILRKLKIAFSLKSEEMVEIYNATEFNISVHEVNALFRKPSQSQYRACQNQFLRNFLVGLQTMVKKHKKTLANF